MGDLKWIGLFNRPVRHITHDGRTAACGYIRPTQGDLITSNVADRPLCDRCRAIMTATLIADIKRKGIR